MQPQCLFKDKFGLGSVMSEMLAGKCLPCKGCRVVYGVMKGSEDLGDNQSLLFITFNLHHLAIIAAIQRLLSSEEDLSQKLGSNFLPSCMRGV